MVIRDKEFMSEQIIGLAPGLTPTLNPWLEQTDIGAAGLAVRDWLLAHYHHAVQDVFGYHALQLGASSLNTLANSRIAHRWIAADTCLETRADLFANASALPFFEATLDLVNLPLTLDAHSDPDAVLDEVARVLVPEGRAIFTGFDIASVWGVAHKLGSKRLPEGARIYGLSNLKASLAELGLIVERIEHHHKMVDGLYLLIAKKRVMGIKPIRRKAWRLPSWSELPLNPFPNPRPTTRPNLKPKERKSSDIE